MNLPITPPFAPMEALLVDQIPTGSDWQYEPKWDGFRCLAFRDHREMRLQSKSGQDLTRYFPELVSAFLELDCDYFVFDGEIAVSIAGRFSFDDLLQRIHPAASRVRRLAQENPAVFILFDLLVDSAGKNLTDRSLLERREALEHFVREHLKGNRDIRLSPATTKLSTARKWFKTVGGDLDGIIAKRLEFAYGSGDRTGMQKIKQQRTADCVIGGFRYASNSKVIGSLLLGLYNDENLLDHVGFCSGLKTDERKQLKSKLEPLVSPPGFSGHAPGGLSRWSTKRSMEWQPLKPKLVVEVSYDHFTGGRFRHGTKLLRWRPDKAPDQCRLDQLHKSGKGSLALL
jgi:ATP-dependent DNA ligase